MKRLIFLSLLAVLPLLGSCEKENIPPTCKIISPSNSEEFYVGDLITISVEANDEDGTIKEVRFYIDTIGIASASAFPFNFEWDTEGEDDGNRNIKVSVKDDKGGSAQAEISIILNPKGEPPVAAFTADTTCIFEEESIQFTDLTTNDPTSWEWDFGDGGASTQQNPSYTYTTAGTYTVSLTVTNTEGSNTKTKTDYILVSVSVETGTLTDSRDGKTYKTVQIGNQTWMAENLAYLPSVVGAGTGSNTTPYHYVYDYDGTSVSEAKATNNYQTYGVLYNWPAALDACPSGWHLPIDAEWKTLEMYLGMSQAQADDTEYRGTDEGDKLKETGTTHWGSPNEGATNESGFTALPGGYRDSSGYFDNIGIFGNWWSASEEYPYHAWRRYMGSGLSSVGRSHFSKVDGFSVRCVRDD